MSVGNASAEPPCAEPPFERPGLSALVQPLTEGDFLQSYRSGRPVVVHGDPGRLPELFSMPQLQSTESLLGGCSGSSITAMLPDRKDESHSVQVDADVARKLHACGMNLFVGNAERHFSALVPWVESLRLDLGLSPTALARSIVYLSPPAAGAPPHFDRNVNLSLQIKGRKRWSLAPNCSVENPTERHVMQQEPSARLAAQMHAPMPFEMPADAKEIELRPGSVLLVPRGLWHATRTCDESIALNFTFGEPSWALLVACLLVDRLHQQAAWRASPARDAAPFGDGSAHCEAASLLESLQSAVTDLDVEMLSRAASCEPRRFRRASGVCLHREGREVAFDIAGRGRLPIDCSEPYLPVFDRMLDSAAGFGLAEALAAAGGRIHRTDVALLIERLLRAGIVECIDG